MTKNIILLHGWTQTKEKLLPLKEALEKKGFNVFLPTLPGFRKEKLKKPWQLDDYVAWLNKFLIKNKIKKTILIGHSFGGQIAVKFTLLHLTKVSHLILISAAVIRKPLSLSRRILIFISRKFRLLFKTFPLYKELRFLSYKLVGEKDYYRAYPALQKTMSQILSENLEDKLVNLKLPVLILWGDKDKTTPLENAFLIKKKLSKAKLVIFKNATHALPYNKSRKVAREIIKFLH